MKTYNNTPFTEQEIAKFTKLGSTINKRRGRNIDLFQHPTAENRVVSIGVTFDQSTVVIAEETKESWQTALYWASMGKVYISE